MNWEHSYYQNNPSPPGRPTRVYYLDVLMNGTEGFSSHDYEECIAAYHAAESEESVSGKEATSHNEQPMASTDEYPSVGESGWFESVSNDDPFMYDVPYHHMVDRQL